MPTPRKPRPACAHCGQPCARPAYTYCSNKCQLHRQIAQKISTGQASAVMWRNYLLRVRPRRCATCGLDTWNGQPIPLELDHTDGNPTRHAPDNLRLLCPNCHAQTATYKNRNAGNGRHYRRLRSPLD